MALFISIGFLNLVLLLNNTQAQEREPIFYDIVNFTMAGVAPGMGVKETKEKLLSHFSIDESQLKIIDLLLQNNVLH